MGALALAGLAAQSSAAADRGVTPQGTYVLQCGGCHGLSGLSNSALVPDLKNHAGLFLNLPEGRRYLVQLPNVAFSTTSNEALAGLLNYVVFTLGGNGVPKDAKAYTAHEVAQLRRSPLTEVSLTQLRRRLVETLIDRYHATTDLRRYGADAPVSPSPPQDR